MEYTIVFRRGSNPRPRLARFPKLLMCVEDECIEHFPQLQSRNVEVGNWEDKFNLRNSGVCK